MKKLLVSLVAITTIFLTGCGITVKQAAPYTTTLAHITDIQPAVIEGKANLVGVGLGAVTGAAVGRNFGKGKGKKIMTVFSTVAGGLIGAATQQKLNQKAGIRVTVVTLDNDRFHIIQEYDPSLEIGQTVRLVTNGEKGKIIK
jgi:outer membrane lipoprotein SlyB